jgi:hypothetical protein
MAGITEGYRPTAIDSSKMSSPTPQQWKDWQEARDAIAILPLRDLQDAVGLPAPTLMPLSGWALAAGLILILIGTRIEAILYLGLAVAAYGLAAILTNRNRAALYRDATYKTWVRERATQLQEEADEEDES